METRYTIDELAAAAELPTSTIRYYQQEGLIDAPTREGRRAYYDERHQRQVERVLDLSERGFSLAAIREVKDARAQGRTLGDLLASTTLDASRMRVEMTWDELAQRVLDAGDGNEPLDDDSRMHNFAKSIELGIVKPVDDKTVLVHVEGLEIGMQLRALGIARNDLLEGHLRLRGLTDQIADLLMAMYDARGAGDVADADSYERFVDLARRSVELATLASLYDARTARTEALEGTDEHDE